MKAISIVAFIVAIYSIKAQQFSGRFPTFNFDSFEASQRPQFSQAAFIPDQGAFFEEPQIGPTFHGPQEQPRPQADPFVVLPQNQPQGRPQIQPQFEERPQFPQRPVSQPRPRPRPQIQSPQDFAQEPQFPQGPRNQPRPQPLPQNRPPNRPPNFRQPPNVNVDENDLQLLEEDQLQPQRGPQGQQQFLQRPINQPQLPVQPPFQPQGQPQFPRQPLNAQQPQFALQGQAQFQPQPQFQQQPQFAPQGIDQSQLGPQFQQQPLNQPQFQQQPQFVPQGVNQAQFQPLNQPQFQQQPIDQLQFQRQPQFAPQVQLQPELLNQPQFQQQPQLVPQGPNQPLFSPQGQPLQPQFGPPGQPLQPQLGPQGQPLQPQLAPQGQPMQPQLLPPGQPQQLPRFRPLGLTQQGPPQVLPQPLRFGNKTSYNCNPTVTNVEFGGKWYFVQWKNPSAPVLTFHEARNSCAEIGMRIISLDAPAKRDYFFDMLERDGYDFFWAGAKITGKTLSWENGAKEPISRGRFPWSDQGNIGPQPEGNGECMAVLNNFYHDRVKYHDVECHHEKSTICECP